MRRLIKPILTRLNMKMISLFRKNITAQLLVMNILIALVFGFIVAAVFVSFGQIKNTMSTIFTENISHILANSQSTRELFRLTDDTHLLISTFYGKDEESLKAEKETLLKKADAVMHKTSDTQLKTALKEFIASIGKVLEQCGKVNQAHKDIEALDHKIDGLFNSIEELISKKILEMTLEAKNVSILEQLTYVLSGCRETSIRINNRLMKLGMAYFESPMVEKDHPVLTLIDDLILRLKTITASEPDIADYGKQMIAEFQNYKAVIIRFHKTVEQFKSVKDKMTAEKEGLLGVMAQADQSVSEMAYLDAGKFIRKISGQMQLGGMIILISAVSVMMLSFFQGRSLTNSLKYVIKGIRQSYERVITAAEWISSSGRQLAKGTAQQAASVEQTSAALEEISSMTKQNADHAGQTGELMKEANQVFTDADAAMSSLTAAMSDISDTSRQTSAIIKTIDEVAFQINLLALNAAIESARAGEAGAGFAVVADEVRNLARRSTDAAKNTAALLEGTIKKIHEGENLVSGANKSFKGVTTIAQKIGELAGEIASASQGQATGIDQLNKAVSEMEKIIQQTAASVQESSGVSEEMKAQAEQMKVFIKHLAEMVEGSSG